MHCNYCVGGEYDTITQFFVIDKPLFNKLYERVTMERSKDWIDEAEGDLKHAKSDAERGYYNWACFSAQQAAEKAVKAVFQKLGAEAWGHSVADLLTELAKRHNVTEEFINAALELDKAYIPARYPNAHPSG